MTHILLLLGSYVIGSLPFGLLIARWWAGIDVREHGSGNIGATNVYRVVGKPAGVIVFALDVLKGYVPTITAAAMGMNAWWVVACGLAALLGHSFSPFLGFQGGKGVSTGLGVLFGAAWEAALSAWAIWGLLLVISGYVSVGAIGASAALPLLSLAFYPGDWPRFAFCLLAGAFSIFRHRANIIRLLNGTELGFRSKGEAEKMGKKKGEPAERALPEASPPKETLGEPDSP